MTDNTNNDNNQRQMILVKEQEKIPCYPGQNMVLKQMFSTGYYVISFFFQLDDYCYEASSLQKKVQLSFIQNVFFFPGFLK